MSSLSMLALGATLLYLADSIMQANVRDRVLDTQQRNLTIAALTLAREVEGVELARAPNGDVTRVELSRWPDFAGAQGADHDFIDRLGALTGQTATIFAYDASRRDFIRRTTNIIKPDGSRAVGTYLGSGSTAYPPMMAGDAFLGTATILGTEYETLYMPIFYSGNEVDRTADGVAGILYVGVRGAELRATIGELRRDLLTSSAVVLLVVTALVSFLSYRMLAPLRRAVGEMVAVARGELIDVSVDRRDEIGHLQKALRSLAGEANRAFALAQMLTQAPEPTVAASAHDDPKVVFANDAAEALFDTLRQRFPELPDTLLGARLSSLHPEPQAFMSNATAKERLPSAETVLYGDEVVKLRMSALTGRDGRFTGSQITFHSATHQAKMASQFEDEVASLLTNVAEALDVLKERTAALENAARNGTQNSGEAAGVAVATAEAVQTVAAAVEELNGSFKEVSERINHNSATAKSASGAISDAMRAATSLKETSERIREAVSLIENVAAQTNLLALNATIEASRAGEAGRGFAVVASEVKSLAERAATATNEITKEVDQVTQAGRDLLNAVDNVQGTIATVDEVCASVAAAVTQQQVTTDEISRTVAEVAESARRVETLSQKVTESSGSTSEAAGEVTRVTGDLETVSRELGTRADRFLTFVREAA